LDFLAGRFSRVVNRIEVTDISNLGFADLIVAPRFFARCGVATFHTALDNVCFLCAPNLYAEANRGIAMIVENYVGFQLDVRFKLHSATCDYHGTVVNRKTIQNKRLAKCHFHGRMPL
jgi:hypothetical protein